MPFPNAPTPLSYGPPQLDSADLDLSGKYFQGAEQRRKYDLARAFHGGIPKGPDGQPDFAAMADVLARGGDTSQTIPLNREALDRQQLAQLQGGGQPPPQGGPAAPHGGPPTASSEPRMVGVPPRPVSAPAPSPAAGAMPQPQLSSAGTDNAGAQTFRAMATELAGGRDVSSIIKNASTALKIDPDAPLTPEQEAQIKPILAKSIAAGQQQQQQGATAPAPPSAGPANEAITKLLPPGFTDPQEAIAKLREAGDNLTKTAGGRGKALADQYYSRADKIEAALVPNRVPHNIGVDALGNPIMGSFDPRSGKFYDAANREIGSGAQGGTGLPDAGAGLLAKGVNQFDSTLHGEDYFNQFSPEVQSAIKSYMRGDTQPTGNPRLKGFETKVKEWARKYGDDVGVPVSDALFSERRKYRTELGSNQAGTAGGQGKAFVQGIEHADALATQLEKLGNWGGFGIPMIADAANMTREALSTKQAGLAAQARTIGQTLAGEVGKLFSGSAGGGVHEREETRKRFNTVKSGPELAGALEGTLETMEGGLRALEKRRNDVLGPKNEVEFTTPDTQAKIARIKQVISRLRGDEVQPETTAPAPGTATIVNQKTGQKMVLSPDGTKWIPAP